MLLLLIGCADYSIGMEKAANSDSGWGAAAPSDEDGRSQDSGDAGSEQEDDFLKLDPAATDAYVFVANTTRGTVTRISVPSLAVVTAEVGKVPSAVVTTSDYKRAVTLNEGSDSVTIIVAETLATVEVPIRENFNRMSLSQDGAWVMCWYDPDKESAAPNSGVQSFNEVSFVQLETATHLPMVVGFNPKGVKWSEDGLSAVVVSDASLAKISLDAAGLGIKLVELSADPLDAPVAEEVELAPDGKHAFVRQYGTTELLIVDLENFSTSSIPMGANPTDMDLSPDGLRLSVVARDARQIWTIDPANPEAAAEILDFPADSAYGSVLFTGNNAAVLYTTASPLARIAQWDTFTGEVTEHPLVKPIRTIGVSPTGGSLLIFHTLQDDPDTPDDSPFIGEWAMTQVELTDFRDNPLLLPAEPTAYSVTDDGHYGFFIMEGESLLTSLSFDSLLPETVSLPSLPVWLGALPETDTAYVSQEHELGRISFYDAESKALDTLTGFELNSGIDHQEK
jgi:DNA-binding beta-propeller fold protein YncE